MAGIIVPMSMLLLWLNVCLVFSFSFDLTPHFRPILRAELPATAVSWARNERNATAAEKVRLLCAPPCHVLL